ncbi:MAG: sulfurtransferase TusA family protein [Sphingobium sp.]
MAAVPEIDARGMRCPWPALRAARAMRSNSAFIVLADDPIAPGELTALAEQQGWTCAPCDDPRGPAFHFKNSATD